MYLPAISELEPIARAAGEAIMSIYSQPFAVEYKQDESPLTAADKGAHEVIVQALARLTPDIPVLSEESSPEVMAARLGWSRYWLVDPLDGTKEFVSRNGEFTVNAPVLDKLWYGGKGIGAWRVADGRHETIQTRPHDAGQVWRVVGSRNHLSQETLEYLARFGELERGEIELVSMGSSLKFCIIAEGEAELYPRLARIIAEGEAELYPRLAPTCEWDTGAAQAVLEGAGGSVTRLDGSPLCYNKPDILNPWFVARA